MMLTSIMFTSKFFRLLPVFFIILISSFTFACTDGFGYTNGDARFICYNSQWYVWADQPSQEWPWATSAQLCQNYSNYSAVKSGYSYGGVYPERNNVWSEGSSQGFYCGENQYCNASQQCVSCSGGSDSCTGQTESDKKVFAFYFTWYDCEEAGDSSCAILCEDKSVLEVTPIFGKNSFLKWDNPAVHKANFARMKRAGIDVFVFGGWPSADYDFGAPATMNQALHELEAEGIPYPKTAYFEDLFNPSYPIRGDSIDLLNSSERASFINQIVNRNVTIFNLIDDKYEFRKDNKKILWLYTGLHGHANKNCLLLTELKQEFASRGHPVFLVAPLTYGVCNAVDAYHNWGQGNLSKAKSLWDMGQIDYIYQMDWVADNPVSPKIDICEVAPGFERPNRKYCCETYSQDCGDVDALPYFPRNNADSFTMSWDYCLQNNEGWIAIETWNEYFESTAIAPVLNEPGQSVGSIADPYLYVKINAEKAAQFKGSSLSWVECEIDEECFINGVQKRCINNSCQVPVNDAGCGTVFLPTIMNEGETYKAFVDVVNIGSSEWDSTLSANEYALGSQDPQDNQLWDVGRVYKVCTSDNSGSCLAGSSPLLDLKPDNYIHMSAHPETRNWFRFVFEVTAPAAGTHSFKWRMLQELREWFGETCGLDNVLVRFSSSCPDVKPDSTIDIFDMRKMINEMNSATPNLIYDISGDGQVTVADLQLVSNSFGNNC